MNNNIEEFTVECNFSQFLGGKKKRLSPQPGGGGTDIKCNSHSFILNFQLLRNPRIVINVSIIHCSKSQTENTGRKKNYR